MMLMLLLWWKGPLVELPWWRSAVVVGIALRWASSVGHDGNVVLVKQSLAEVGRLSQDTDALCEIDGAGVRRVVFFGGGGQQYALSWRRQSRNT